MRPSGQKGFTLIEIAIVMVIIGLLTGGGISMLKLLTERKARNDNQEYLQQAKDAILSFANIYGRLPRPDTTTPIPDGREDACATPDCVGFLPFITLNIAPNDAYQRGVKYEISNNPEDLQNIRGTTCNTLSTWDPNSGRRPLLIDLGSPTPFAVAAILVSGGPMDADGAGGAFDVVAGAAGGNNITGTPNYIRSSPTNTFDDVVVFIGGYELNSKIDCAALRCSAYEIWNNLGATAFFRVNGIGCSQILNNSLISSIGPGGSVFGYSDASCSTATTPTSRTAAAAAISDTNRNCVVNFTGSLPDP